MPYHPLTAITGKDKDALAEQQFSSNLSKLKEIAANVYTTNELNALFNLAANISDIFSNLNQRQLKVLAHNKIISEIFINALSNGSFLDAIKKLVVVDENKLSLDENLPHSQFIKVCLYLSTTPLACCLAEIPPDELSLLRNRFTTCLYRIKDSVDENVDVLQISNFIYSIATGHKFNYKGAFIKHVDITTFFRNQSVARNLIVCMLHATLCPRLLGQEFKRISRIGAGEQTRDEGLKSITGLVRKIKSCHNGFEYFKLKVNEIYQETNSTTKFLNNFIYTNEAHLYALFKICFLELETNKYINVSDLITYIERAKNIRIDLANYASSSFQAYKGNIGANDKEWANKVYLSSYKMVSVLESLVDAVDTDWKTDVAMYEIMHWIAQVHEIINRNEIQDDWEKISKFLGQENNRIEWKSSFYISTEGPLISLEVDKSGAKQTLLQITRAMLAMMNTDGGTIIVGLVEKPNKIVREDIKLNLAKREKYVFLDLGWEMGRMKKSIDELKQHIIDILKDQTLLSADVFNKLWSIHPIELKIDGKKIMVCKLNIARSEKYLFSVKAEGGAVSLSLLRRANGRTINIDPRSIIGEIPIET